MVLLCRIWSLRGSEVFDKGSLLDRILNIISISMIFRSIQFRFRTPLCGSGWRKPKVSLSTQLLRTTHLRSILDTWKFLIALNWLLLNDQGKFAWSTVIEVYAYRVQHHGPLVRPFGLPRQWPKLPVFWLSASKRALLRKLVDYGAILHSAS